MRNCSILDWRNKNNQSMENSIKLYALTVGGVITCGLWILSLKRKNWREYAWLFTLHLTYQIIKEYESRMNQDVYSWAYTVFILSIEVLGLSNWSSVSPILMIRQVNPLLDPYFPPNSSLIRLLVLVWLSRFAKRVAFQ